MYVGKNGGKIALHRKWVIWNGQSIPFSAAGGKWNEILFHFATEGFFQNAGFYVMLHQQQAKNRAARINY